MSAPKHTPGPVRHTYNGATYLIMPASDGRIIDEHTGVQPDDDIASAILADVREQQERQLEPRGCAMPGCCSAIETIAYQRQELNERSNEVLDLVAENERLREALEAVLVEGNRLCVACCHLDGDGTYDETRCWNEVRTDARAALAKGKP